MLSRFAFPRWPRRALLTGALALLAASMSGGARADDDAKQLLKAMSDYMAAQKDFSFSYQSSLEAVTPTFEKLQFVSSGKVTVHRPDKIRMSRTGGFVDAELVFDGTTLTVHGKNLKAYAQVEAKGTLADLGAHLADAGIDPPGADLISADAFDALMDGVTEAKHIASAYVDGVECEYLAFRKSDTDWAIWIAAGDRPIPLRYVITSKDVVQAPQYTVQISDWKGGADVAADDFAFKAPDGEKKVDLSEIELIDELPSPTE